jgi:SET domain-containing protein
MFSSADLQIRNSRVHCLGVFAVRAIPAGTRVLEYLGKRVTKAEGDLLDRTYCFKLDEEHVLDGVGTPWNPAGFINHSCEPNCRACHIEGAVWIVALRDISPAEELTYNYGYKLEGFQGRPCHCGAPGCVGYVVAERFFPTLRRMRENGELSPGPE